MVLGYLEQFALKIVLAILKVINNCRKVFLKLVFQIKFETHSFILHSSQFKPAPEQRSLLRITHEIDEDADDSISKVSVLRGQELDDRQKFSVSWNILKLCIYYFCWKLKNGLIYV